MSQDLTQAGIFPFIKKLVRTLTFPNLGKGLPFVLKLSHIFLPPDIVNQSLIRPHMFMVSALVLPSRRNTARLRANALVALRQKCQRPEALARKCTAPCASNNKNGKERKHEATGAM